MCAHACVRAEGKRKKKQTLFFKGEGEAFDQREGINQS